MTTFQMCPIVSIGFQGPAATWMPCWPVTIAKTGAGSFEIQSQREAFDLSDVKWAIVSQGSHQLWVDKVDKVDGRQLQSS